MILRSQDTKYRIMQQLQKSSDMYYAGWYYSKK